MSPDVMTKEESKHLETTGAVPLGTFNALHGLLDSCAAERVQHLRAA